MLEKVATSLLDVIVTSFTVMVRIYWLIKIDISGNKCFGE